MFSTSSKRHCDFFNLFIIIIFHSFHQTINIINGKKNEKGDKKSLDQNLDQLEAFQCMEHKLQYSTCSWVRHTHRDRFTENIEVHFVMFKLKVVVMQQLRVSCPRSLVQQLYCGCWGQFSGKCDNYTYLQGFLRVLAATSSKNIK